MMMTPSPWPSTSPAVFVFATVLIFFGIWTNNALAQSEEEAIEAEQALNEERARRLYNIGDDHYAHGRYEEALAAFEESYELSGHPTLLYNMANAQERAGLTLEAVESLEAYLPHAEEHEQAAIEARIVSLRERAERVDQLRGPETPEVEENDPVDLKGPLLLAAGGAAIITTAVLWIRVAGVRSDHDGECNDVQGRNVCRSSAQALEQKDRRLSISADVLMVAGVAVAGVGLYFLLTSDDDEEPPATDVSIVGSPNGVFGSVTHAF